MHNFISLLFLSFALAGCSTCHKSTSMNAQKIAEDYNEFQNDFGQSVAKDYKQIIDQLFTDDFKKIANGAELVSQRKDLEHQLHSVMKMAGNWTMSPIDTIPSADGTKCVMRYMLDTKKAGKFEVIAILNLNNGKIHSIDEVYHHTNLPN